jgi:hypothetical protein
MVVAMKNRNYCQERKNGEFWEAGENQILLF